MSDLHRYSGATPQHRARILEIPASRLRASRNDGANRKDDPIDAACEVLYGAPAKNKKMLVDPRKCSIWKRRRGRSRPRCSRRCPKTSGARASVPDCFIEGPSLDAVGNLYIVDIPFGRVFKITPDGQWSLAVEYEGWPNGLKISPEGRIRLFVAHASLGHAFLFAPNGELIARVKSCAGESCTNVAIGGNNGDQLYITESMTGTVLVLVADISSLNSSLRGASATKLSRAECETLDCLAEPVIGCAWARPVGSQ